jgi:hypothetical protein
MMGHHPRRRLDDGLPCTLSLIGGTSDRSVAAVLITGDGGREAACWYNRALVRGPLLALVEQWALRTVASVWETAILDAHVVRSLVVEIAA